jgi:hypothetical protein
MGEDELSYLPSIHRNIHVTRKQSSPGSEHVDPTGRKGKGSEGRWDHVGTFM